MKINNLLITGIGGDVAQSSAKIIRKDRPNIKLIGTDAKTRHSGKLFVDEFRQVPSASDLSYLEHIKILIHKFKIDVLLPISEAELAIYAKIDNKIDDCLIIHCGKVGLEIGLDKLKTSHFLQSINAPYPWTILAKQAKKVNMPCIIKPKTGSGPKGFFLIESQLDFDYFKQKYPEYIFQELLIPNTQEITCAVYRNKLGEVYVLQMLRQLNGNSTGWAKVINNEGILRLCKEVANKLDIKGSINIQLINTKNGPRIFEINPRISSTVAMRNAIGFKDVVWLIDELEEKVINKPQILHNATMFKIHDVAIERIIK